MTAASATAASGCRMPSGSGAGCWDAIRKPLRRDPEQNVLLPTPVPIYVTYLTAQADGGQLSFIDDIYGRDAQHGLSQVAALR